MIADMELINKKFKLVFSELFMRRLKLENPLVFTTPSYFVTKKLD